MIEKRCDVCGGELCMIRAKYPNGIKREVCPTCMVELVEGLMSYKQFGAMQDCQAVKP